MDHIIRDSSIYEDIESTALLYDKDSSIRVGVVRSEIYLQDSRETRYSVEVWDNGRTIPVTCIRTSRFGGVYNYEEYTHRGFNPGGSSASTVRELQQGDQVIVAYLNGDSREGVILGCINHRGRQESLVHENSEENGPEFANREGPTSVRYISEFNGIETIVNSRGEFRQTFKGQPKNLDKLTETPDGSPIPEPKYDESVSGSYYEWDDTGSFFLTDNSQDKPQHVRVDKQEGTITIVSGDTSFTINKNDGSYTVSNKSTSISSSEEINLETKKTSLLSSDSVKIESKKCDSKIDKWNHEGSLVDVKADAKIKGNIQQTGNTQIQGQLSSTGQTMLAGGSFPLVYDIALTIGTGNLGAPVVSNNILLKTSLTKAS